MNLGRAMCCTGLSHYNRTPKMYLHVKSYPGDSITIWLNTYGQSFFIDIRSTNTYRVLACSAIKGPRTRPGYAKGWIGEPS